MRGAESEKAHLSPFTHTLKKHKLTTSVAAAAKSDCGPAAAAAARAASRSD